MNKIKKIFFTILNIPSTFITLIKGFKKTRRKKHLNFVVNNIFEQRKKALETMLKYAAGHMDKEEYFKQIEAQAHILLKKEQQHNRIRKYVG